MCSWSWRHTRQSLFDAEQPFGDAEVVHSLGDAEQRRNDNHTTTGTFEKRSDAFLRVDFANRVADAVVSRFAGCTL